MKNEERQLLFCLNAYRLGQKSAELVEDFCNLDWQRFYALAAIHKLGAVVCETLWNVPGFCGSDSQMLTRWQKETVIRTAAQAAKTQRLLRLTKLFEESGISYAVVKGVLCRELYKRPDLRPSGDEDILIMPENLRQCSALLQQHGLECTDNNDSAVTHWLDPQTGLHIELHTELFSSKRASDGLLNECFMQQLSKTTTISVPGGLVRTFVPTYHFFFLVCHAIKHFITGGFGIRTLCDIVTYAEQYREEIDRQVLNDWLEKVGGRIFLEQVLFIGQKYLSVDLADWELSGADDSEAMLEDILEAGVYGQSSMSRRHSGALVLRAAEEGQTRPNLMRAAFPPREQLAGRYPILNEKPALLPFVWLRRLANYGLELIKSPNKENSLRDNIEFGKQRTEMMIQYGIISRDKTKN